MSGQEIRTHLLHIAESVKALDGASEEYGGWPGEDEDAAPTVELAYTLLMMALPVALGGREYAEGEADLVPSFLREVSS